MGGVGRVGAGGLGGVGTGGAVGGTGGVGSERLGTGRLGTGRAVVGAVRALVRVGPGEAEAEADGRGDAEALGERRTADVVGGALVGRHRRRRRQGYGRGRRGCEDGLGAGLDRLEQGEGRPGPVPGGRGEGRADRAHALGLLQRPAAQGRGRGLLRPVPAGGQQQVAARPGLRVHRVQAAHEQAGGSARRVGVQGPDVFQPALGQSQVPHPQRDRVAGRGQLQLLHRGLGLVERLARQRAAGADHHGRAGQAEREQRTAGRPDPARRPGRCGRDPAPAGTCAPSPPALLRRSAAGRAARRGTLPGERSAPAAGPRPPRARRRSWCRGQALRRDVARLRPPRSAGRRPGRRVPRVLNEPGRPR